MKFHENRGSVKKGLPSKAAAAWARGAYGGVREHDQGATCLRVAAPGLRSRSYFGGVGSAKAGNVAGGPFDITQGILFQHS